MTKSPNALKNLKNNEQLFRIAIQKYFFSPFYKKIILGFSISIMILQCFSIFYFYQTCADIKLLNFVVTFIIAYVLTDFIGGLIHMYMDNNTHYNSRFGFSPFIAAFHLHHSLIKYPKQPPLKIYFHESGFKFWLFFYLLLLVILQQHTPLWTELHFCLVCIGILSSFAEVSHFWCHHAADQNQLIQFLQKIYVLLPPKHHAIHHECDNKNYAFLNGISDPLLNIIARYLYTGYKNNADQHAKAYFEKP